MRIKKPPLLTLPTIIVVTGVSVLAGWYTWAPAIKQHVNELENMKNSKK